MNDIEQRLREAGAEVRQVARKGVRKPLPQTSRGPRGWLVFAAAFAAVVLVGLIPLLLGDGETTPAGTTFSSPSTPSTSVAPTTTGPEESCSATGVDIPASVEELPPAVADKHTAISQAAAACDLLALSRLAGEDLTTSFGGGGFENLELWEAEGTGQLGTLLEVLGTSHAVVESGDRGDIYVWPAAFAYDTWDEIPTEHVDELGLIYTQEEIEQIAEFGAYAGWRAGIDETGNWLFFVAGD